MIDIPLGLRSALEGNNCVLFLGAGIGCHLHYSDGTNAPNGHQLLNDIADHFSIEVSANSDLSQIARVAELRHGRAELIVFLKQRFSNLEPDDAFKWLFQRKWAAIFTTNYDDSISRAYELIKEPLQQPIFINLDSEIVPFDPRFEVPIYQIHGSLYGTKDPQIIISENDYSFFREKRRMLFEIFRFHSISSPILYVGYSNQDPNWKLLMDETNRDFAPSKAPQSYRISLQTDPIERELLEAKNIVSINCSYKDFYNEASVLIKDSSSNSKHFDQIRNSIPSDLVNEFDKNPAPVARLINNWDYVNQISFHDEPNANDFIRGDRPNWSLIGKKNYLERDIEEEIYEDLLEFATSSSKKTRGISILGPAGYGVTTLLMTLAVKLVEDNAGSIFMLKPGNLIREGDIEFASSIINNKRCFLFIDNAVENIQKIRNIIDRLNEIGVPCMIIMGSRLNEWRQCPNKGIYKEFILEPLSDPEIYRLIDFLSNNRALGVLEALSVDLQFSTIKMNHDKQLLVTMREVTEGKSFDAIIESEFRNINSDFARNFYLAVCCFSQLGVYIRDQLLAQILNISEVKMYDSIQDSTDGVVFSECIDNARGIYASRARHRIIATIVWERCVLPDEKDSLLRTVISELNLNYGVDKDAFEKIVRTDRIVDQINSLDGKIRFFENAINKDPNSPYIKQHYSRMLRREDKSDLALYTIEKAIEDSPRILALHHTRGMILADLVEKSESPSIARKYLAQSEKSFRNGLSIYPRDDYCYQGLAQLYICWSKKAPTVSESTEYLTKAEDVISEGLNKVNVRSGLWIESANIQTIIGNEPSRILALEKAVNDTPGSFISRYLLAKQYRISGRFSDAIKILEPVIKSSPDEVRSHVEYAYSLAIIQNSYDEAISVLRLSTLYGFYDPRFIATLGGMLFMSKKFTESAAIFDEVVGKNFTGDDLNEIQFKPWIFNEYPKSVNLIGKVILRRPGFAFIETKEFPKFICPGSKFNGLIIEEGLKIEFEPAFSARGPLAINPQICS